MNTYRPVVGVAIVVQHGNKVLLGKRKGSRGAGKLAFPGGHVEANEYLKQAAQRELLEEVGSDLQTEDLYDAGLTEDLYPDAHYITHFFITDYLSGDPKLMEPEKCEGWEWYDIDDLKKLSKKEFFQPARSWLFE